MLGPGVRAQVSLLPADPYASFIGFDPVPGGSRTAITVAGQSFSRGLRVTTAGGAPNLWEAQLRWATVVPVARNDTLLLTVWARQLSPRAGDSIHAQVVFEREGGDYAKSLNTSLPSTDDQWRLYQIPFRSIADFPAGGAALAVQFAAGPQSFEIGGIELRNYGQTPPPLPTSFDYSGREPGAAWRVAAEARIDQHRKAQLTMRVMDSAGNALPGASVTVTQQTHAFPFGTAINASVLMQPGPDRDRYRAAFSKMFNAAVIENHLKWPFWEQWGRPDGEAALAWLTERGVPVRGHNVIWPGWSNMPGDTPSLDAAALRSRIDTRFAAILSATAGVITDWDIVNEPYSNIDVTGRIPGVAGVTPSAGVLGNDELARWFTLAGQLAPGVTRTLNDYNLLAGLDRTHREYTMELVRWMQARGAGPDQLGLQGHFFGVIIPPEELGRRFDTLATLGVPLIITEFDVSTTNEPLQADYTRDVVTLAFSRPEVTGFLMWGFWEGAHWEPVASLFRRDWSEKPAASAWRSLVWDQWWTRDTGVTGADGARTVRAFKGEHEVVVSAPGLTPRTLRVELNDDRTVAVRLAAGPLLPGGGEIKPARPLDE